MPQTTTSLFLLLTLIVGIAAAQDEFLPRFQPADECFVDMPDGADYDCGYVTVPEFHDGSSENTLLLGVIRLNSTAETPTSPVFFGAGGPGGSIMPWAAVTASDVANNPEGAYAQLLAERDLIYFTQRGTQFAQPYLNCPEEAAIQDALAKSQTFDEHLRLEAEALTACFERLTDEGVNLDAFDSLENAADVNTIREVFGYDQIVYYGESYGTILGQHIMQRFPEILESAIFDGTASLSITSWEDDSAVKYDITLDRVVELCQQDAICNQFYPTFATDIDAIYEQAETNPVQVSLIIEGETFDVTVTPDILSSTLYTVLYDVNSIGNYPLAVQGLLNEDPFNFQQFLNFANSAFSDMGILMHAAVVCAEDPISADDEVMLGDGEVYQIALEHAREGILSYGLMCDLVAVNPIDETDENPTVEVPTLIISGALDPATPNFRSDEVKAALPNSFSVTFPYGSHVQARPFSNCAVDIMVQFIADPQNEPDSSCVEDEPAITFNLPTPSPNALIGTTLRLTTSNISGELLDYEGDAIYKLTFVDVDIVTIQADCSTIEAAYILDADGNLSIDFDLEAVADCGEDSFASAIVPFLEVATITSLSYTDEGLLNMVIFSEDFDSLIFAE